MLAHEKKTKIFFANDWKADYSVSTESFEMTSESAKAMFMVPISCIPALLDGLENHPYPKGVLKNIMEARGK